VKVGVDTLRKATFVVAGLVVATGVPTLVLAFGNGGSAQPATSALSHRHTGQQPATAAGSSDTTSTTSSSSAASCSTTSLRSPTSSGGGGGTSS